MSKKEKKNKDEQKSKFKFDPSRKIYVYDDGVTDNPADLIKNFQIYYAWICEKADQDNEDYKAWKETLGFLSGEKYRAYVEKDQVRIRLLELGMLMYINTAVKSKNPRVCILGFRQAVQWGYPSALINCQKYFSSSKRYLRFLLKIVIRYFSLNAVKSYNIDAYAYMGKFEEFLISLLTLALNRKMELLKFGRFKSIKGKRQFYSDSAVNWDWLTEELDKSKNKIEFKKNLNLLHTTLHDFIVSDLSESSLGTFTYWRNTIEKIKKSKKKWMVELAFEEESLYKKFKTEYDLRLKK